MEESQNRYQMVGNYSIPQADIEDCDRCHNAELGSIIVNGLCLDCRDLKIAEKDLLKKIMVLAQQSLSPVTYGKLEDVIDELIINRHIKAVLGYEELELELNRPPGQSNPFPRVCNTCYRYVYGETGEYCQLLIWDHRGINPPPLNSGLMQGRCDKHKPVSSLT